MLILGTPTLPHEHNRATRSHELLLLEMPRKLQRSRSCHDLPAKTNYEEDNGTLLSEAERSYYGYISGKFTLNEFKIYARHIKSADSEAFGYLKWLAAREKWVFVQGDVLRPGVEKWKRPRLWQVRKLLMRVLREM